MSPSFSPGSILFLISFNNEVSCGPHLDLQSAVYGPRHQVFPQRRARPQDEQRLRPSILEFDRSKFEKHSPVVGLQWEPLIIGFTNMRFDFFCKALTSRVAIPCYVYRGFRVMLDEL